MAELVYTDSGQYSPYAGGIGWVNFSGLKLAPGKKLTDIEATFKDGSKVLFDITSEAMAGTGAGTGRPFSGATAPTYKNAPFAVSGYVTKQSIIFYEDQGNYIKIGTRLIFDRFRVKSPASETISHFTVVVADGETTHRGEKLTWATDGGGWQLLINLPTPNLSATTTPTLTGIGTQTVTEIGINDNLASAPVMSTQNPTKITIEVISHDIGDGGRQGIAIGFALTGVSLQKNIVKRRFVEDQFKLMLGGTQAKTLTTTGKKEGLQTEIVRVYGQPGHTFKITEEMAAGSKSCMSDYIQSTTVTNLSSGGISPPLSTLPINGLLTFGDIFQYCIENTLKLADIWVDKSTPMEKVCAGDLVVYTLVVGNSGPDCAQNVVLIDQMDTVCQAMMYQKSNDDAWQPWTGKLSLGNIEVGGKVIIYLKGRILSESLISQLSNTAVVTTDTYDPNLANNQMMRTIAIETAANLSIEKSVDKVRAYEGDQLTYTLTITNKGPSSVYDAVLTDQDVLVLKNTQYCLVGRTQWQVWQGSYPIDILKANETISILIKGEIT